MIAKRRQCVLCKNHVAMSKVKFTVRTYSLCAGLNETYSCLAHNFVVGPASGMVRYKDLVFHSFIRSHHCAILLEALGGGISVLWTHFFSNKYIRLYFVPGLITSFCSRILFTFSILSPAKAEA